MLSFLILSYVSCSPCVAGVPFDLPSDLDDAFSKHVYLHRALLKDDMIEFFNDPTMRNVILDATVIGNDGNPVAGYRSGCREGSIN